jgi:hypothetical protein
MAPEEEKVVPAGREARGTSPVPPPDAYVPPTERGDRVWNRTLAIGLLLAVIMHAAILLSSRQVTTPEVPHAAAGPAANDARAAAGGGGMEVVQVRVREERAPIEDAVPEPVPIPEVPEVEPEVEPQPDPEPAAVAAAPAPGQGRTGEGPAVGELTGPGLADGTGRGGGGADAEGTSGIMRPVPRGMVLPPSDAPRSARGREYRIFVYVSPQGRVVSDSTRMYPPTADARFNRRLMDRASEWVFEPARRGSQPVGSWYEYTWEF